MFKTKLLPALMLLTGTAIYFTNFSAQPIHSNDLSDSRWLVQGESIEDVERTLAQLDVDVSHRLTLINGVAATLSSHELNKLRKLPDIRLTPDGKATLAGANVTAPYFPNAANVADLHGQAIDGEGVTCRGTRSIVGGEVEGVAGGFTTIVVVGQVASVDIRLSERITQVQSGPAEL